jgi:hypothetical protein
MTLANIVRLNAYATDMDELLKHWTTRADRFGNPDDRLRPACSASRSSQHHSYSSCSRQPRSTDPLISPHQTCETGAGMVPAPHVSSLGLSCQRNVRN